MVRNGREKYYHVHDMYQANVLNWKYTPTRFALLPLKKIDEQCAGIWNRFGERNYSGRNIVADCVRFEFILWVNLNSASKHGDIVTGEQHWCEYPDCSKHNDARNPLGIMSLRLCLPTNRIPTANGSVSTHINDISLGHSKCIPRLATCISKTMLMSDTNWHFHRLYMHICKKICMQMVLENSPRRFSSMEWLSIYSN